MKVIQTFRKRKTETDRGKSGHTTIASMLQQFPWLSPLVEALQATEESYFPEPKGWIAVFFIDLVAGEDPKIFLSMIPREETIWLPSLPIQEGSLPTLEEVKHHLDKRKLKKVCTKENKFVPPQKDAERWTHKDAKAKFPDHDFSIVVYHCPNCGIDFEIDEGD